MRVFHQFSETAENQSAPSAVAIGNFDGCHLGHRSLIGQMVAEAKANGLKATILTFFPHPVEVLNPGKPLERLMTASEKLAEFEKLGAEVAVVAPFDRTLAQLSATEFFHAHLLGSLRARSLHVGFDFRFGKGRSGTVDTLRELCQASGIKLGVANPVELDGVRVSSSEIRKQLQAGRVDLATRLLGRPYSLEGMVEHGEARGKDLGFPTANLNCPAEKEMPRNGVYVTRALWQRQIYRSVTNIGVRPTFTAPGEVRRVVEIHLLDFQAKIYDETLSIAFLARIRDEKRFDSVDSLVKQIQIDVETARHYVEVGREA